MRELTNSCCLHHVSGGWGWNGDPSCPGCNGEWDDKNQKSDIGALVGGGVGSYIGGRVGAVAGSWGGLPGSVAGLVIGTRIGQFIDNAIDTNYLPPIGDDSILLEYIRTEQPW